MKKTLSVFLAVIMALSCLTMGFTASAYEAKKCINVTLSGIAYVTPFKQAVDDVNKERADLGAEEMVLDANLTNLAKKRAAQLMLFVNSSEDVEKGIETLPNGDSASTIINGYGSTTFTGFRYFTAATKDNAYSDLKELVVASGKLASLKSIGGAFFKLGNDYAYYVIISLDESKSPLANAADGAYSTTEALNVSNITKSYINLESTGALKGYKLTTKIIANGFYGNWINISNSLLSYSSSNSKIVKVKGTKAYTKKSGNVNLIAKNKSGAVVSKDPITSTVTTYKPVFKSVKSSKKKQMTVKWQNTMGNADGFEIQIATDKNFKKNKKTYTVKGRKKASYTIKKLKRKKKYYVRVRAYINQGDGEKLYTSWTGKKTVKVR